MVSVYTKKEQYRNVIARLLSFNHAYLIRASANFTTLPKSAIRIQLK